MIRDAISTLVDSRSLTRQEASAAMTEIMEGEATASQVGAFLIALRLKGETVDEIAGFAEVMRSKAVPVHTKESAVDTCGTGGDGSGTFNISTAAAFVAAGAGMTVAKHGNRAMSSRCGSADVLEALGVNINLGAAGVERCIAEVGIGFMFAPNFHPAMKYAAGTRREIGVRTVFNILGPLTNPARAAYQVLGVGAPDLASRVAAVLAALGIQHALVVHGEDGVDEISISAPTIVHQVGAKAAKGTLDCIRIAPEDFGMRRAGREAVVGGTAQDNAQIVRDVLSGAQGPRRDIVLLNSAAALIAGGRAPWFEAGIALAAESVDSGRALAKLDALVAVSQRLAS